MTITRQSANILMKRERHARKSKQRSNASSLGVSRFELRVAGLPQISQPLLECVVGIHPQVLGPSWLALLPKPRGMCECIAEHRISHIFRPSDIRPRPLRIETFPMTRRVGQEDPQTVKYDRQIGQQLVVKSV